jgi:hypothetical protein
MMRALSTRHGFAMIRASPGRHSGFDSGFARRQTPAWMIRAKLGSHGKAMIVAKRPRHPRFARMMRAPPARHGFAMMWASPTRHPGSARMIRAKLGCHGGKAAMIKKIYRNDLVNQFVDLGFAQIEIIIFRVNTKYFVKWSVKFLNYMLRIH